MNIIGIVCEYNPFHKGHAWQIEASREALGEDSVIVCAMSGDYATAGGSGDLFQVCQGRGRLPLRSRPGV
ncbi:MAG: nucleotidyltransferase family protein [Oscillospiraceae bacterium]